jgi:hypothetical protein
LRFRKDTGDKTKLTVNEPGDQYEVEADRVADQVMRMTSPGASSGAIQRKCEVCEEDKDKRSETAQGAEEDAVFAAPPSAASPVTPERLIESRTGGETLPAGTRHTMESAIGHDFSQVRIHHGAEAGEMNRRCFSNAPRLPSNAWSSDCAISEDWPVSSAYLTITRWRAIWTFNSVERLMLALVVAAAAVPR